MFHQFFFFKQKTSYEMRISDWSSDVCSSDLPRNKSGVTVGGGLLAFLPRLLRIRREQVPEIIALVPKRRGVAVGHRAGDAIIRLGEARAGLPVDLLAHVVAGVVVVARQEGFPRLLTAIAVAGAEEHRGHALLRSEEPPSEL